MVNLVTGGEEGSGTAMSRDQPGRAAKLQGLFSPWATPSRWSPCSPLQPHVTRSSLSAWAFTSSGVATTWSRCFGKGGLKMHPCFVWAEFTAGFGKTLQ